jgi:ABC-2 type transport system permease protein
MKLLLWFRPAWHMVRKEFRQFLRDRQMLRMSFMMPIVQMLVLGYAATTDLKNIRLAVLDQDHTQDSRTLVESFFQNTLFVPTPAVHGSDDLAEQLFRGHTDMTLWIPNGYAKKLTASETATVGLVVDGENSNAAARGLGYALSVIRQAEMRELALRKLARPNADIHQVESQTRFFYNPELLSRIYMVPGIIVMLITMLSGMMCGMAIVREKEIGTLEQLLVTPLTPGQIILGKLVLYGALAIVESVVAATIGIAWFGVPLRGSVLLLFFCLIIYLLNTLGGALLASTVSHTQQQAMFTIWFFTVFGILTSGYFYPVENMPKVVYYLSYANPIRFFIGIVRDIFLKGSTLPDVLPKLIPLFIMATVVFAVAFWRFRKRLA